MPKRLSRAFQESGAYPKRELGAGGRIDAALREIVARALIVREILLEEPRGARHHLVEIDAAGLARALRLARQLQARALREIRDRVEESELLVLHEKADHGAVRAAAEAVIELLVGAHPERRRFLGVERAAGLVFAPGFLERHARADDFDDIGACDDLVDERLWDATGHGPGCDQPPSLALILAPTAAMSARPCAFALMMPITLPMSLMLARAGGGDRLGDQGIDFRVAQLRGQVALQQGDFRGFLVDQIRAVAGLELHQRIPCAA